MSNKKNLLNENTIRRMMKLASVDSLSDSFISTKYTPINESEIEEGKYGDKKEEVNEEETVSEEATEVVAEEEEVAAELDIEDEGPMDSDDVEPEPEEEKEEDEEEGDDEVTLTDDEAREIIALADKLRAAMGEDDMEDAMDAMDDAEDEMDDAEDAMDGAMDAMDGAMDDEPGMGDNRMEEDLFEAALKGLDIEIVEDKKVQLENLSKEIYKKVVARLLQESKK